MNNSEEVKLQPFYLEYHETQAEAGNSQGNLEFHHEYTLPNQYRGYSISLLNKCNHLQTSKA